MKNPLLAAIIAGVFGNAAIAEGPEPYIEYVYPVQAQQNADWTGFYAGGLGGAQSGEISPGGNTFTTANLGGFAGYNFQKGQVVYGAEVAAQLGTMDLSGAPADVDLLIDAKARVGYSFGDALLFASGGYTTTDTGALGGLSANGWNAGAGLDYALSDKFFVGGAYIYRSLPNATPAQYDYASHGGQMRAGIRF